MRIRSSFRFASLTPILILAAMAPLPSSAGAEDLSPAMIATPAEARWSLAAARGLRAAIDNAAQEGLTPADYAPDQLDAALAQGAGPWLDTAADASAMALARDYFLGRVQNRAQFDWHIERSPYEAQALNQGLADAVSRGRIKAWLASLLPTNPQYAALRDALPSARSADAELIRANMERWRWLPRELGDDYLFVNVPTYQLRVMRDGQEAARYDVVVGAPKTPTPSLAVAAERVVVNPWWTLPPTVLAEGKTYSAARGFVTVRAANGRTMVRQKPGPANALGRLKIDMPNADAIYLHDTPAKAAFARKVRALSHGCIRVKDIDQLAASLQGDGQIEAALGGTDTKSVALEAPLPVYIVYLTAEVQGGRVKPIADVYDRDSRLLAALDNGHATRLASVAGTKLASR